VGGWEEGGQAGVWDEGGQVGGWEEGGRGRGIRRRAIYGDGKREGRVVG